MKMVIPPAFSKKTDERRRSDQQSTALSLEFMKPACQTLAVGPWNNFGQTQQISESNVSDLFLDNDELLDDEHFQRPRKHGGQKRAGTTILNEIGDSIVGSLTLKSETRLGKLDDEGNWIGSHRGKLKKRHLEEFHDRVSKRAAEKQAVCNILSEWNSLSIEEQQYRQRQAEQNMKQILSTIEVVETEEIPEEYFAHLSLDDEAIGYHHRDFRQRAVALHAQSPDCLQRLDDITGPPQKRVTTYKHASKSRIRDPNHASNSVVSRTSTPASSPLGSLTTGNNTPESGYLTPGFFHFSGHNRNRSRRSRLLPPPPPIPSHHRWHEIGNVSQFSVVNIKPLITPLLDLTADESFISNGGIETLTAKVDALSLRCSTEPRVVIVKLQPGLEFSAQKLLERCKGAKLQSIQWFPGDGQGVLFFLDPLAAKAFVEHVESARNTSDHEARRLQIAVSWVNGISLDSIYPAQKNLLSLVLSDRASRCIKVNYIPTNIQHRILEAHFKAQFSDLVGLRLIRPAKMYEKLRDNSACALLDFSSINHAVAARAAFEAQEVANFEHCCAEFVCDPCSVRFDKAFWCKCMNCSDDNVEQGPTAKFGFLHGRHSAHLGMALQKSQYDARADSKRPDTFVTMSDTRSTPIERD